MEFIDLLIWAKGKPENIIACCAIIISLISLLVAGLTLWFQRKHNHLSLRPIAQISRGDYEDQIFVKIKNYGMGPLIVESFKACVDDTKYDKLIDLLSSVTQDFTWNTFTDNINGRVLSPNKEFVLIQGTFSESDDSIRESIRERLSMTTLTLTYKNIYNQKQPAITERLVWFAR